MINEDYVSSEIAKLLRDKGFNEPCYACYIDEEEEISHYSYRSTNFEIDDGISAPTIQMTIKWLRIVHNQNIIFDMLPEGNDCYVLWTFNIISNKNYKIIWGTKQPKYKTYKEVAEAAIKYCLENLI